MRFNPLYRSLDAWRGVACVAIAFHHASFLLLPTELLGQPLRLGIFEAYRSLNLGVPLFFVISGYCIAASLDAHRVQGKSAWQFLVRRFWRIYPPYWAAVAGFAVIVGGLNWLGWEPIRTGTHSLHLETPGRLSWDQWLGNLTLSEEWRRSLLGGAYSRNLTRISWTLGCEQLLYLTGFVLLLIGRRWLFGALGITLGVVVLGYFALDDVRWVLWKQAPLGRACYQFAVGVAVYWRLVEARSSLERRVVEGGLLALLIFSRDDAIRVGAVLGVILIALRPLDRRLAELGILAPFRACGLRCYSIYLIHLPVGVVIAEASYQAGLTGFWTRALVATPLAALVSIAAGWPFYRLVEARCYRPRVVAAGPLPIDDHRRDPPPIDLGPELAPASSRPDEVEGESAIGVVVVSGAA